LVEHLRIHRNSGLIILSTKVVLTVILLAALCALLVAFGGGFGTPELVIWMLVLVGGLYAIWRRRSSTR
jgi:fatty acid desaturase